MHHGHNYENHGYMHHERPKGAKDEVERPEGPPAKSRGPEGGGPQDFYIFISTEMKGRGQI